MTDMLFRRRRLPHQDVEGHPIFVTACVDGSLSAAGLSRIEKYRKQLDTRPKPDNLTAAEWEYRKQKLLFAFVDKLLDGESPVRHLEDERQAEIVQNAFLHFAGERYKLLAFVVMPSHHHWLFLPDEAWAVKAVRKARGQTGKHKTPREIISHSIQSYTATICNRVRGKTGTYWQHETFDHWARDEAEALRIIEYIEMNPVKAGLVETPEQYRWSSARIRKRLGILPGQPIPRVVA
jgi:REP element-mobilizing transposase RayT